MQTKKVKELPLNKYTQKTFYIHNMHYSKQATFK